MSEQAGVRKEEGERGGGIFECLLKFRKGYTVF